MQLLMGALLMVGTVVASAFVGVGSAASAELTGPRSQPTESENVPAGPSASTQVMLSDKWTVKNYTEQPIHGVALKQSGDNVSTIYMPPDRPLQPGNSISTEHVSAFLKLDYLWGRFCYRGSWWDLPRQNYSGNQFHVDLVPFGDDRSSLVLHLDGTRIVLIKTDAC